MKVYVVEVKTNIPDDLSCACFVTRLQADEYLKIIQDQTVLKVDACVYEANLIRELQ